MSWGAPHWLWALAALPLVTLLLGLAERRRRRRWLRFAAPETAARIDLARPDRPVTRTLLLVAAVALMITALARPRWGEEEEEIHARGLDLVIALDLSRSMLAEDIAPSRLVVGRALAAQLADALATDRVGLIGFAGQAEMLCPLTLDRGALALYLDAAEPSIFPDQGTDLGAAIDAARAMFRRQARARRVLVILSDGEDQEGHAVEAARRAAEEGIRIYAIGLGTEAGAPIPERDAEGAITGYRTDREGRTVTTRLVTRTLASVAEAAGGAFVRTAGFGQGAERVAEDLARIERDELATVLPARRAERYRWPLTGALLLAAAEAALIRRRRED